MSIPDTLLIWLVPTIDSLGHQANQGHVLAMRKRNERMHARDDRASNPISDLEVANPSAKSVVTAGVPNEAADILAELIQSKVRGKGGTSGQ
jgi:hypothetical protein